MQDASNAFDTAAATHRTWVPPRLRTDWADDDYDGDGTVDDLSPQVSSKWQVDHTLDDGYPSTVSFVSGSAIPELETELTGRVVDGVPMTAAAYWSPLRTDSPVYGHDRDVSPLTLDTGLITADGPEYVRIFTGQMTGAPVRDGVANLTGISATRIALMKPVQPPAVTDVYASTIMSSWVVSWCLHACGLYAGPRPRPGTVAYFPLHGGLWRFHDAGFPGGNVTGVTITGSELWRIVDNTPTLTNLLRTEVEWLRGPYVAAPDLYLTTAESRRAYVQQIPLGDTTYGGTTDVFSQAAAAGRLEMWIRGDPADVNTAPGGSGSVSRLAGFQLTAEASGSPYVQLGVSTDRKVHAIVFDGSNIRTLKSTGTLATDGEWYFVGAAFDVAADKLWVNLNGTVESSSAVMVTTNLPATDLWEESDVSPYFVAYLPVSDITLASGAEANVDNFPLWRSDASFAPTARLALTTNRLTGVLEKTPREAWKIIAELAQADLAMMRCDELDVFEYLPLGWWVRDEQQTVQALISTARNAAPFSIDEDATRIRTSIKVSYTQIDAPAFTAAAGQFRRVFELGATSNSGDEIRIPPGATDLRVTFSTPAMYLYRTIYADSGVFAAAEAQTPSATYITLNDSPDGTGTEYAYTSVPPAPITITVTTWDPGGATLRIVNGTGIELYLANDENCPVICLTGIPAVLTQRYVQVGDDGGARGERLLEVTAAAVQQELSARRLAQNLLANLRHPRATIGDEQSGIAVVADPRRQPGDLVAIEDTETGVGDALWRLQSVRHKGDGASHTQEVVVRRVYPIAVVGEAVVGQSLVGPLAE